VLFGVADLVQHLVVDAAFVRQIVAQEEMPLKAMFWWPDARPVFLGGPAVAAHYLPWVSKIRPTCLDFVMDSFAPIESEETVALFTALAAIPRSKKRATGAEVIAPTLAEAHWFVDGLAKARRGKTYGYIGSDGAFAIAPRFGRCEGFAIAQDAKSEGRAVAGPDDDPNTHTKWGYIDPSGEYVVRPVLYNAGHFEGGLTRAYANPASRNRTPSRRQRGP